MANTLSILLAYPRSFYLETPLYHGWVETISFLSHMANPVHSLFIDKLEWYFFTKYAKFVKLILWF